MITKTGPQCDSCDKMIDAKDFAQPFYIPPGKNFGGICRKPLPGELARPAKLIACPSCWPKVKRAIAMKAPALLPIGRLRRALGQLVLAHGVHNMRMRIRA